jgi:PAS domain S-box-containing protein
MVKDAPRRLTQAKRALRSPHLWLIVTSVILATVHHYSEWLGIWTLPQSIPPLTREVLYSIFYLVPIVYSGAVLTSGWGLVTSAVSFVFMLPRAFVSSSLLDPLVMSIAIPLAGAVVCLGLQAQREQREVRQRAAVEVDRIQERLRAQWRTNVRLQKRLTSLSTVSGLVSQSLELDSVLRTAIDMVMEVMAANVVLIFRVDETAKELTLVAYEGVPWRFAAAVDRMKVGEGFNGRVAESGKPLVVEDASNDPRLSREVVRQEQLQAQLIVPMKSRGRVMGTLCVATRQRKDFAPEEIDLLTAIGNEIGIALENAHLYQEQLRVAKQLETSERKYRELFERAPDAIWVHDMDGNIVSANEAATRLTGYELQELCHMNVRVFLSEESLRLAREVRVKLLQGQPLVQPYEQRIITKQGNEAIWQLNTNLITADGKFVGFEHIARDVTEERRMEENLHFYLQHITKAQEEERKRLARELHDSTAQTLFAILHHLESFLQSKANLRMDDTRLLWKLHEEVKTVLQEVRQFGRDLRPSILDDLGLIPALEWLADETGKENGIDAKLEVVGSERRFSAEVRLLLFRIIQEALRNVARHSSASQARVTVAFNKQTTKVTIEDNGKGFTLPSNMGDLTRLGKLGLAGMQERARLLGGSFKVESDSGKGTRVIVEVPV